MQKRTKARSAVDDMVSHLLHRAAQRADSFFSNEIGKAGMTARQVVILLAVAERESSSQAELVEATGIDRSTIAEMVRRMVQKGLLERRRSRADARAKLVRMTGEGERALKAMQPKAAKVDAALVAGLPTEQRKTLKELLRTISAG